MRLVYHMHPTSAGPVAEAAIQELCDRLRSLSGAPVKLVAIRHSKAAAADVVVLVKNKPALSWIWLTYDAMIEPRRAAIRVTPYPVSDAKTNCIVRDLAIEYLGWRPRKRKAKASGVDGRIPPA